MKKHDWLNKTESPPPPPMGDNKIKKRQAEAFERVAADPGKHWREDGFDEVVSWERLSVRGKVIYLSWCAANYGVPYDRLVKAVLDAVGGQGLVGGKTGDKGMFADELWTLMGQFEGAHMLLGPAVDSVPITLEPSPEIDKNHCRER